MVQDVVNVGSKAYGVVEELFYLYVVSSLFKYTCNPILLFKKSSFTYHFETNNKWN
jgi:hypothetical protein